MCSDLVASDREPEVKAVCAARRHDFLAVSCVDFQLAPGRGARRHTRALLVEPVEPVLNGSRRLPDVSKRHLRDFVAGLVVDARPFDHDIRRQPGVALHALDDVDVRLGRRGGVGVGAAGRKEERESDIRKQGCLHDVLRSGLEVGLVTVGSATASPPGRVAVRMLQFVEVVIPLQAGGFRASPR